MIQIGNTFRTWGLLAALVCVSGVTLAQANTVTYQGVLRDVTGDPVADGPYAMSFGIFATDTGGAPIWTESQTAATSNGAFSVELGAVTPLGTLFADNAGAALWLEVSADVGAGMQAYTPRVPLSRAPYAFHASQAAAADDADTLDGKHAADIDADIAAAVSTHDASGAAHSDIRTQIGADIAAHDASGTAHGDIRSQIGTDIAAHDADPGAHSVLEIDGAQITSGKISNLRLNTGPGGGLDADTLDGTHLVNIGINTDNKISVHNNTASAHPNLDIDAGQIISGTMDISRLPTGTAPNQVALGNHVHDGAHITTGTIDIARLPTGTGGSQVALGNHVHSSLAAADGDPAQALAVDNAGNVGIGTVAPGAKLEVNNTLKFTGDAPVAGQTTGIISRSPRVIMTPDTRVGCPPAAAVGTDLWTQSFTLTRSAVVIIHGETIGYATGRRDLELYVDGAFRDRNIADTYNLAWTDSHTHWGGVLAAGSHTVSLRSAIGANVFGCGSSYGRITTMIFE